MPAIAAVLEGINLPRFPSVPGRLRAKSKPVETSQPSRPAQRLEMLRLNVPPAAAKHAEVLGQGPEAAPAVVAVLRDLGLV
jgi:electron transfer flavoprotein beta subunit